MTATLVLRNVSGKIVILILFLSCNLRAQDRGMIPGLPARHFQLKSPGDTIDFILINGRTDVKKPVLIFCQGSNPVPLVTILPGGRKIITSVNFDYKKVAEDYHLILISMPHTPVEVPRRLLSNNFCVISDTNDQRSYFPSYLADNDADNYIRRARAVIEFLSGQSWVSSDRILMFGHSQGSKVALGASLNNPKVFKVAYASGNPLGRIDQLIREQRKLVADGRISHEDGQKQIEGIYEMWRQINEAPDAVTTDFGDPNKTWTSFSKPVLDDLLQLKQPLYVPYGTADITSSFCDLLPVYFIRAHKNNLTLVPYAGLEHNFFEVDKDGKPNYERGHWQEVIDNFILWANE